jgi:3'-phosphoadenosine 5'-phosphosulfate sulfotransferase (PAPS reductase)/FAD synthetase
MMNNKQLRHILNLSGGKDSAALAIYLRDRIPDLEYVFCDTKKELPETYEYLDRLEAYLGRRITRLDNGGRDFDHHLALRRGFLPSPRKRWCTEELKIKPFERYVGNDQVLSYVGLRADEDREGYLSTKPNIVPVFPFKDDGLTLHDVLRILEGSGLGLPRYYQWRSRSGCFFCFYQRKIEWVGLFENHPDLFEEARRYEKPEQGRGYTWCDNESLGELAKPERVAQIKREYDESLRKDAQEGPNRRLGDLFADALSTKVITEVIETWET